MSPNLALIGCGAIAQRLYLGAIARRRSELGQIWLVDRSPHSLGSASAHIPSATAVSALENIEDRLDYVIIATPNDTHFPLAMAALSRDPHVLVEKPVVIWPEDGIVLANAASARKRVVAVNQTRRLYPVATAIRNRIRGGDFGVLKSIHHEEGQKFAWPFESGAAFARTAQRTGVIMDLGVHVIDFLQMIVEAEWTFVSCEHDGFAGPEGLASISLTATGAPASIRLSRYVKQRNRLELQFDAGLVSLDVDSASAYEVKTPDGRADLVTLKPAMDDFDVLGDALLTNFLAAGAGEAAPICSVSDSLPTILLLDDIYRGAAHYPFRIGAV